MFVLFSRHDGQQSAVDQHKWEKTRSITKKLRAREETQRELGKGQREGEKGTEKPLGLQKVFLQGQGIYRYRRWRQDEPTTELASSNLTFNDIEEPTPITLNSARGRLKMEVDRADITGKLTEFEFGTWFPCLDLSFGFPGFQMVVERRRLTASSAWHRFYIWGRGRVWGEQGRAWQFFWHCTKPKRISVVVVVRTACVNNFCTANPLSLPRRVFALDLLKPIELVWH
ncbi:hypothetical protein C8J55DRAFT_553087 [Lentinula edodes]|uniref:Uncharacterized protein n=1 Tax=Lentinula lateritia TaxID=40482 RepID=A0A9W8ZR44_9AGAR|nr:hypothetical protein C8J55DRAFT_553087 [Lentinula edodes]